MGKPSLTQAMGFLTGAGIRADRAYPHAPMPRIGAMAVAVSVHKEEDDAVSYAALVCVPPHMGSAGCEAGAAKVAAVWRSKGASCTWGGCGYDSAMDVYTVTVYGRWEDPPVTEE